MRRSHLDQCADDFLKNEEKFSRECSLQGFLHIALHNENRFHYSHNLFLNDLFKSHPEQMSNCSKV